MNTFPWTNIRNSPEEWKHVFEVAVFHQKADNKRRFQSLGITRLSQLLFRESLMTHCATVNANRCMLYFHSHASKASGYLAPYICFLPPLLLSMVLLSLKFSLLLVANALPSRKLRPGPWRVVSSTLLSDVRLYLNCEGGYIRWEWGSFYFRITPPPHSSLKLLAALLDRYIDEETAVHLILNIIDQRICSGNWL